MLFAIDFDGTLSVKDSVDALLERHAPAAWHAVEADWAEGRITAQTCMQRQIGMLSATEAQLALFFAGIEIDTTFPAFLACARRLGELAIISDGIGRAIEATLAREGLCGLPVFANKLVREPAGWALEFVHADADCQVGSGVCKCAVARRLAAGGPIILIGDGRSDACLARRADFIFAKDGLARHCEVEGIAYTEFRYFSDVLRVIRTWPVPAEHPALSGA